MKKHILSALASGLFLYLLTITSACLTVLDISDSLFTALLTAAFVLGSVTVIFLFLRNRTSWRCQLFSVILWQAVFGVLFLVDSLVGITRSLVAFPEENLAGGLILVLFWMSFTGFSLIGFLFSLIVNGIRKFIKAK